MRSHDTVRAWGMISNHRGEDATATITQDQFDGVNFLDGYNLYLDVASVGSLAPNTTGYSGALKFSFHNPMPDNKYKVFLNVLMSDADGMAHVVTSSQYPKTNSSFYVRCGAFRNNQAPANNPFNFPTTSTVATADFQMTPLTLLKSLPSSGALGSSFYYYSIGLVVFA